jgi:hypothetical protein
VTFLDVQIDSRLTGGRSALAKFGSYKENRTRQPQLSEGHERYHFW